MDNEWKKNLRERFSDYAVPEPEGLWEGIAQGMAGKPRRKMLPVWLGTGLAAAAAVALVFFLHPENAPQTPGLQKQAAMADASVAPAADPVVADTAAASSPVVTGSPEAGPITTSVPFAVASRHTLLSEAGPAATVPVSGETVPDTVPGIEPETVPPVPETVGPASGPAVSESYAVARSEGVEKGKEWGGPGAAGPEPFLDMHPKKRFSIGAFGNGGQASNEQVLGYGMNRTGEYLHTRSSGGEAQDDLGGMMRMLTSNRASTFEARHAAPFRAGVTAAWELTPHLHLVSGLNWTYLDSEFEETAGPVRTVTNQELGYLGVPLRLEAGFPLGKALWLFAGAGGMVEKGLMGSSGAHTWVEGQEAETVRNPAPDTGGLLWSVGVTAGAEYRFSPSVGLYFSPGAEYHFDNGSQVRSAYTERPLHWNVNLGVRFHFGK